MVVSIMLRFSPIETAHHKHYELKTFCLPALSTTSPIYFTNCSIVCLESGPNSRNPCTGGPSFSPYVSLYFPSIYVCCVIVIRIYCVQEIKVAADLTPQIESCRNPVRGCYQQAPIEAVEMRVSSLWKWPASFSHCHLLLPPSSSSQKAHCCCFALHNIPENMTRVRATSDRQLWC